MKRKELIILAIAMIIQMLVGLWYLGNYNDYLDNHYLVDGLASSIKVFFIDFFLLLLFLVSLTISRKIVAIGIAAITLIQTSNIFLALKGMPFPLKGLILTGVNIILLFIIMLIIIVKHNPARRVP